MTTSITRRTGAIARIVDDNLNSWEDHAGQDLNIPVLYQYAEGDGPYAYEQAYWSYRGQSAICARTTDGALVRVRIGDGTAADRTIYRQIITDPTNPAQWTAWTQLYTGDHFAIAIQADASAGAGYRVFHAKSDGLYVDNTKKITKTNIVGIKPVVGSDVDTTGIVYYKTTEQDGDGDRAYRWWYTPNINAGSPSSYEDCATYRQYRHDLLAFFWNGLTGGEGGAPIVEAKQFIRLRAMSHSGGARSKASSATLTSEYGYYYGTTNAGYNVWNNIRFLKGPSAQAGYKTITNMSMVSIDDPRYSTPVRYLFYNEQHYDAAGSVLSNLKNPLFWSRAVDRPYYFTSAVPTGYSVWGFGGAVEWGGYLYAVGNGRVIRRPLASTSIDVSDYLASGEYELPRDNEAGKGTLTLANPKNILGAQLGMTSDSGEGVTEQRVEFGLGVRRAGDADYTYKSDAAWWVSTPHKTKDESGATRIALGIGDFWHKLSNKYRDTYRQPGRFSWTDWLPAGVNQLFNYAMSGTSEMTRYNPVGAAVDSVPRLRATPDDSNPYGEAVVLFAGWRGENAYVKCRLWTWGGIVFRYVDQDNYYKVEISSTGVRLTQRLDGVATRVAEIVYPFLEPAGEWMEVTYRWGLIRVLWNTGEVVNVAVVQPEMFVGFAGVISTTQIEMSSLFIEEFHTWMTTSELIRVALAHADEHEVVLELDEDTAAIEQIDLLWGPQSDLDTPDKALRSLLETSKVNIVWLPDDEEVGDLGTGRLHVGRFIQDNPSYTIDNEIIAQDQADDVYGRANVVAVDGEDYSWTEYDRGDLVVRDTAINSYLDQPEITTPGGVRQRAIEELNAAWRANSPGGDCVWQPWFTRMDNIFWITEDGSKYATRIEGLHVSFDQGTSPMQHATLDTGLMEFCPPNEAVSYLVRDLFERDTAFGLGESLVGGSWVIYS